MVYSPLLRVISSHPDMVQKGELSKIPTLVVLTVWHDQMSSSVSRKSTGRDNREWEVPEVEDDDKMAEPSRLGGWETEITS